MLIKDFVAVVPSTTETIAAATRTTPAGGLPATVVAAAPVNNRSQQEPTTTTTITAPITITAQPTASCPSTAPIASARLSTALSHRIGSTGSWLFSTSQFAAWETLLWLHGPTGSGKTVLASALVQHLRQSQSAAQRRPCLFYLFDGTDARETNGLEAMLKGFVGQLHEQDAGGVVAVPSCGEGEEEEKKLSRVAEDAIVGMEGPLDVVVDGIDECAERAAVVQWLDGVMQKKKGGMRLCVSSRHAEEEPCFGERMRRHGSQRIALDAAAMSDDIKAVAQWALSNDARFGRWQQQQQSGRGGADAFAFSTPQQRDLSDADFRRDVVDTIVKRADGIVQLVPHHLDALAQSPTLRLFKRTLATLPSNLADTHARLLSAVPTAHRRSVIRLLRFALYSSAPLTAAEATDALAVSLDMEPAFDAQDRVKDVADLIAGLCPRLLEVRGSGDDEERVHVAHGSVREYLLSDPPAADGYSDAFAERAAKAEMARVCMAYLAAVAGVWWRNAAAVPWEVVARAFPFAGYASRHWAAFARADEGVEEAVVGDVMAFVADEKTRALLAAASPSDDSSPFHTPLSLATQAGLPLTVSALLKAQPPPSADDCTAALVHACANNNPTAIAAALLSGGADPNTSSGLPLTLACTTAQSPALVDLLLSAGADPTLAGPALPQTLLTTTTAEDNNNNLAVLATLLAHPACAATGIAYWTPALATACEDGLLSAAQLFHSHGILPRLPPAQHGLLLRLAARSGHPELVALLLLDSNDDDHAAAAAAAALDEALWNVAQTHRRAPAGPSAGHVATLATLAAHSAALTARFWRGLEGQVCVMGLRTLDAVLAAVVAPGSIADGRGRGAGGVLERVCSGGAFDGAAKARMLLARGVVDAAGDEGAAALRAACRGGDAEVARLLVERGADPYAEGPAPEEVAWEGWANAFAVAERAGRRGIVDVLSRDRSWEAEKMRRVSFHVSHSRLRNDWKRGALGFGGLEA